jgi:hypothetical protein
MRSSFRRVLAVRPVAKVLPKVSNMLISRRLAGEFDPRHFKK